MGRIRKLLDTAIKKLTVKKYLLYALGEIILIVAGVLIAVNINNYNDGKKKVKQLDTILRNVSEDLKADLTRLNIVIADYERIDSISTNIVENKYADILLDSINESNYQDCVPCFAYHIGFETFSPKLDGYSQLKQYELESKKIGKDISQKILVFYSGNLNDIDLLEEILARTTIKNLESLEIFDWYGDYILNNYNKDAIKYFLKDVSYKNKLITYKLLSVANQLTLLQEYKAEATDLIKLIDQGG